MKQTGAQDEGTAQPNLRIVRFLFYLFFANGHLMHLLMLFPRSVAVPRIHSRSHLIISPPSWNFTRVYHDQSSPERGPSAAHSLKHRTHGMVASPLANA